MNCRKCKKEIPEDAAFCCWCGTKQAVPARSSKTRGNGFGCAYKRGKTWTIQITTGYYSDAQTGKRKRMARSKGGFKTKTEALNYAQTLRDQLEVKYVPTLAEYWETYSSNEMERISAGKRTSYRAAWRRLHDLHNRRIDTITVSDLRKVVAENATTFYPARDMKVVLSHLFRLAAADRVAAADLPSFINLPKKDEAERETFTFEEQALLWDAWERGCRKAAIPLILLYTGMMPIELNNLESSMLDLENKRIVNVGRKTKIRKKLSVLLPDVICPVIEEISRDVSGRIFPVEKQTFYKRYYEALQEAGIERHLTPYCCRHTTATLHAIDENTPPELLTRIMRWSSYQMADRYVHPSDENALAAVNELKKPSPQDV